MREAGYRVQIGWVGLEDEEPIWEPMLIIYADASKYPVREQKLRRMRLNSVRKCPLKRKSGMNLWRASVCSADLDVVSMDRPSILFIGICSTIEVCIMVRVCIRN